MTKTERRELEDARDDALEVETMGWLIRAVIVLGAMTVLSGWLLN